MGLSQNAVKSLSGLLTLALLAWIVELVGLAFLQRSCNESPLGGSWQTGAQLPASSSCYKVYRFLWWAVVLEFPIVVGLVSSVRGWAGEAYPTLTRFRFAWLALLAVETVLQMWAANVALNLTDTTASKILSNTDRVRATVAFVGFAVLSAINILIMFVLGDEGQVQSPGSLAEPLVPGLGRTDV